MNARDFIEYHGARHAIGVLVSQFPELKSYAADAWLENAAESCAQGNDCDVDELLEELTPEQREELAEEIEG